MISRPSLSCILWWEFVYTRMLSGHHFFMMSFHLPAIGSMTQRHPLFVSDIILRACIENVTNVTTPCFIHQFAMPTLWRMDRVL